jgi:hypothetical protein
MRKYLSNKTVEDWNQKHFYLIFYENYLILLSSFLQFPIVTIRKMTKNKMGMFILIIILIKHQKMIQLRDKKE